MGEQSRPHWSYSALNQYLRCPLQYYFERVLRLPRTSVGSGLVLGSSVHNALAFHHLGLKNGSEATWHELQQSFLETWVTKEDEQFVDYKPGESRDDLIEQGLALVKLYLSEPPPEEVVAVEQRFLIPLHNSDGEFLETPLLTFIDLLSREAGVLKINEFKTSGRSYGEFEVESSLQATCYTNAVQETFGQWVKVEFIVFVKTKRPKIQRMKTSRSEDDLGRLGDLVETVEGAVKNQVFYPNESPLNCSTCCYRKQCREWRPERKEPELVPLTLNGVERC